MGLAGGAGHALNTQRDRLCAVRLQWVLLIFRVSGISGFREGSDSRAGLFRPDAGRAYADLYNLGPGRSFERLSHAADAGPAVHSFNVQRYLAHKSSP